MSKIPSRQTLAGIGNKPLYVPTDGDGNAVFPGNVNFSGTVTAGSIATAGSMTAGSIASAGSVNVGRVIATGVVATDDEFVSLAKPNGFLRGISFENAVSAPTASLSYDGVSMYLRNSGNTALSVAPTGAVTIPGSLTLTGQGGTPSAPLTSGATLGAKGFLRVPVVSIFGIGTRYLAQFNLPTGATTNSVLMLTAFEVSNAATPTNIQPLIASTTGQPAGSIVISQTATGLTAGDFILYQYLLIL